MLIKWNIKENILKNIYSLIYGIFGCLGFICLFNWFAIVSFHEINKYPHRYPMYITLGMVSLIVCIVTFILNIKTLMKEKNRIKYILLESLVTLIIFILFFFILEFIDEKIQIIMLS